MAHSEHSHTFLSRFPEPTHIQLTDQSGTPIEEVKELRVSEWLKDLELNGAEIEANTVQPALLRF